MSTSGQFQTQTSLERPLSVCSADLGQIVLDAPLKQVQFLF
jgi:hypothetical protein